MMAWIKRIIKAVFGNKPAPLPSKPVEIENTPISTPVESENTPIKAPGIIADFEFVDSSHHHNDFDVKKYNSRLLINKTSQGTSMTDRTHSIRKKLCKENGIIYGGYHFYECKKHWKDQLNHYLNAHGSFQIGPILDFETWEGNQSMEDLRANIENAYKWMIEAEQITGKTCILYAGYHVLVALNLPPKFKRFIPWIPRYANSIGKIPAPFEESDIMAWQYTESGKFPGFSGGNDVNIYYGKNNRLKL